MTKTHTPAPWWRAKEDLGWAIGAGDHELAFVGNRPLSDPNTDHEANARLIQAAPDMRAVLLSLRDVYGEHLAALPEGLRGAILAAIARGDCP